jgi:hypothetical protein
MLAAIVSSAEYFQRHGNDNSRWLNGAFVDLLGRAREPATKPLVDALNAGTPRGAVATQLASSLEYGKRVVTGYASQFLGRPATAQEQEAQGHSLARGVRVEEVIVTRWRRPSTSTGPRSANRPVPGRTRDKGLAGGALDFARELDVLMGTYGKRQGDDGYLWYLDYNGDGTVNYTDWLAFRDRLPPF